MANTKSGGKHRASTDQEINNAAMRVLLNRAIDRSSTVEVLSEVDKMPAKARAAVYQALES